MKRTITRLAIILIAAIMLGDLAACDRDKMNLESIEFTEVYFSGTFTGSSSKRPSSAIVRSQEELVALFSGYSLEWEDDISISTQYDSEYFENNALVFHFFGVSGNYSPDFSVEDMKIAKETLKLFVVQKGLTDGYAYFDLTIVVEVGKTDTANVTKINAAIDIEIQEELALTEELESRIKANFLHEFGYELYFGSDKQNKFYGLYNNTAVFFIAGSDTALKTVSISGVEFRYNYQWTILVWNNGNFYDLENIETIFDMGFLTQKDIETIGILHLEAHSH